MGSLKRTGWLWDHRAHWEAKLPASSLVQHELRRRLFSFVSFERQRQWRRRSRCGRRWRAEAVRNERVVGGHSSLASHLLHRPEERSM